MEKSFTEYLTSTTKVYSFTIKIVGDLEESLESKLKESLQKFAVTAISKGKRTPIQPTLVDFPNIENDRVTTWEVSTKYPTTTQVLENYISTFIGVPLQKIKVCNLNAPLELYQASESNKEILSTNELESPCSKEMSELVGSGRTTGLLKDIVNSKKTTGEQIKGVNDSILAATCPQETAVEYAPHSEHSKSPIGSQVINKPEPVKGK
jgi:hypothetical protein